MTRICLELNSVHKINLHLSENEPNDREGNVSIRTSTP